MYTLVDFITHVKGIEYIMSISAIAGFLIFWESLKSKPFKTVVETGKDDLGHIEQTGGFGNVMKSVGKIAAAPFIGLAYIVMLPVGFFAALAVGAVNLAMKGAAGIMGKSATFEWRPVEAYLAGKKRKEKAAARTKNQEKK
ncbi:MAG: hypothetical protein ACM32I_02670 [Nitrospirota bacterium]